MYLEVEIVISIAQLTKDALSLPLDERIQLAQLLWESVNAEPESSQDARADEDELLSTLERRNSELENGTLEAVPYDQALNSLRKSLK